MSLSFRGARNARAHSPCVHYFAAASVEATTARRPLTAAAYGFRARSLRSRPGMTQTCVIAPWFVRLQGSPVFSSLPCPEGHAERSGATDARAARMHRGRCTRAKRKHGRKSHLRSAHNGFIGLQLPAAPWPGALTECGASALLGPWAAHPVCRYVPSSNRRPAYATGPSHPLRAVTYTAPFN